ncbi:MAG: T9SS type A sorting domain-containing protein, partial [Bacteroidetes bacterium]|nr:T9SS type A sorting domain-containing protein [Bacteroidota bacterium]
SSIPSENGNDMVWNPTKNLLAKGYFTPVFGGKHYVYIMGNKKFKSGTNVVGTRYDECASYASILNDASITNKSLRRRLIFSQAMWVTMPMVKNDKNINLASIEGGIVPNEATVKLRVKRPYAKYINSLTTAPLANDSAPFYKFSTASIVPTKANSDAAKQALDMITVSPNPYYAYAGYENPNNQLDTKVKIINLPNKCTVSIFTMNGFLVRRFRKDDDKTFLDWDLKNEALVPIVSGVYLIHIDAQGMGERVIKWFGIMRPVDFDTF